MRSKRWYQKHLDEYFTKRFGAYESTTDWFCDPAVNQWWFYIPELGFKFILTCDEQGKVTEQRYK